MERRDLQPLVGQAIGQALTTANVPLDGDHRRRLVRVLLRAAARLVIDVGVPAPVFIAMAVEALGREANTSFPAAVPETPKPAAELN